MKKLTRYFLSTLLGLFVVTGISFAEEASADKQDIVAACTEEARGAIDVEEYISSCVKEKEEELKEVAEEAAQSKEKS